MGEFCRWYAAGARPDGDSCLGDVGRSDKDFVGMDAVEAEEPYSTADAEAVHVALGKRDIALERQRMLEMWGLHMCILAQQRAFEKAVTSTQDLAEAECQREALLRASSWHCTHRCSSHHTPRYQSEENKQNELGTDLA